MKEIIPGTIYQHYKGKHYKIVALATHTETLEPCVVYQAPYNDEKFGSHALWRRPVSMFCEELVFNGTLVPRFYKIENQ